MWTHRKDCKRAALRRLPTKGQRDDWICGQWRMDGEVQLGRVNQPSFVGLAAHGIDVTRGKAKLHMNI